jgi:hypothetical protein
MLKLSLRFLLPLLLVVASLAYVSVPLLDRLTLRWFMSDLDQRSQAIAATLGSPLREAHLQGAQARVESLLNAASADERLQSVAICDAQGQMVARSTQFPPALQCAAIESGSGRALRLPQGVLHATRVPLRLGEPGAAASHALLVLHDMSFIELRSNETRWYAIAAFAVLGLVVALVTVAVAHLSWRGWVRGVRAMLTGEGLLRPFAEGPSNIDKELLPLEAEVRSLYRRLERQRAVDTSAIEGWSAQRLRAVLQSQFADDEIIVVSNRQPYSHERRDGRMVVTQPASGLVTALEPVLRAASGTWIAHGSGSADAEVADRDGCVQVPPEQPAYTLRRLWLTPQEVKGYYEGFANEGLWPLCHIAHVRPVFRADDWRHFVDVSQRFADAVVKSSKRPDPLVLVQDYHMPLVPQMIRDRLPQATVVTFWHIPWPMSETFGICPWREEILEGLLGSHIMGFQTPSHCRNFIDAVDTFLESRIEHEDSNDPSRRPADAGGAVPDLDRLAAGGRWSRSRPRARACSDRSACRRGIAWPSASTGSTTSRGCSSALPRSSICCAPTRSGAAASRWCRSRRRRAAICLPTSPSTTGWWPRPSGSTPPAEPRRRRPSS